MFVNKQKKSRSTKGNRFLISITVLGSPGPIRFVVNENELVVSVIDSALKSYAREGRLPVIGSNLSDFTLCCPVAGIFCSKPMGHYRIGRVSKFHALQEAASGECKHERR